MEPLFFRGNNFLINRQYTQTITAVTGAVEQDIRKNQLLRSILGAYSFGIFSHSIDGQYRMHHMGQVIGGGP
jgi:hypothetical protein